MSTNDHNDHAKRAARIELELVSDGDYAAYNHQCMLDVRHLAEHVRALKCSLQEIEKRGVAKCYYLFSECIQNRNGTINFEVIDMLGKEFSKQVEAIDCGDDEEYAVNCGSFFSSLEGIKRSSDRIRQAKSLSESAEWLVLLEYAAHKGHGINIENL